MIELSCQSSDTFPSLILMRSATTFICILLPGIILSLTTPLFPRFCFLYTIIQYIMSTVIKGTGPKTECAVETLF